MKGKRWLSGKRRLHEQTVEIIGYAKDFNSRMLRLTGNWVLMMVHPWEYDAYGYSFAPDKMFARNYNEGYVATEDPARDLQRGLESRRVLLTITPGLCNYGIWAVMRPNDAVPHVRSEVTMFSEKIRKGKEYMRINKGCRVSDVFQPNA